LLSFTFENQDFSKGYERKKQKIRSPFDSRPRLCKRASNPLLFDSAFGGRGLESGEQKTITQTQDLRKQCAAFALAQMKPPENIRRTAGLEARLDPELRIGEATPVPPTGGNDDHT
jgi:hypothetical protein